MDEYYPEARFPAAPRHDLTPILPLKPEARVRARSASNSRFPFFCVMMGKTG